jgi:hypothetical protein
MKSGGSSPPGGTGPPKAAPPYGESTPDLDSIPVSSCDFISMYNFRLYNPRSPRGLYIVFSSCFVLSYFCQELILSFESAMASSSDDKGKRPREEDPKLKEE